MAKAAKQEIPAHQELAEVETKIFGKTVLRDASGQPMERGHGSNFQKLRHADRSHYLTLAATTSADEVGELCTTLNGIVARLVESQKGARAAAEKAAEDAALAELAANEARGEIDTLTNQLAAAEAKILALTAKIKKLEG